MGIKRIGLTALLAVASAIEGFASLPMLTFFNGGDSLVASFDDAPRILYDNGWYVDYNAATDKFLSDEGLGRYRSVKDDVLARVAMSRMFMTSKLTSLDPLQVTMTTFNPADLNMSPRVYIQMKELLAMLNRTVADGVADMLTATALDEEHAFRDFGILCKDNDIWEKDALNPGTYAELSFTEPLPRDKGPQNILADTLVEKPREIDPMEQRELTPLAKIGLPPEG